ncbi:hypothetical protein GGTG_11617 [Gaeumannomyces tritici R3-111a-1]|uniref:Uncharacterized protein n=1 Tax=Gaeumannomyces tritici (strain R3-111a-1) TaxID=644352 RepID=J3PDP4_GAET3|nr:hypothetical protein GGTG_11617 [Gaeumannomyces tritici R3-111a-1]EJT70594.1 hypothetical protein GGTG_11617 [Gaeumannomyces tritici R3-111a-1]
MLATVPHHRTPDLLLPRPMLPMPEAGRARPIRPAGFASVQPTHAIQPSAATPPSNALCCQPTLQWRLQQPAISRWADGRFVSSAWQPPPHTTIILDNGLETQKRTRGKHLTARWRIAVSQGWVSHTPTDDRSARHPPSFTRHTLLKGAHCPGFRRGPCHTTASWSHLSQLAPFLAPSDTQPTQPSQPVQRQQSVAFGPAVSPLRFAIHAPNIGHPGGVTALPLSTPLAPTKVPTKVPTTRPPWSLLVYLAAAP